MTKVRLTIISLLIASVVNAGINAYIFTPSNTPASGYCGEVIGVQACSTNSTGSAKLCSITDLSVSGKTVSFTNCLADISLTGGTNAFNTNGVFVASKQRIIVSGTAFGGGAITIWIKQ